MIPWFPLPHNVSTICHDGDYDSSKPIPTIYKEHAYRIHRHNTRLLAHRKALEYLQSPTSHIDSAYTTLLTIRPPSNKRAI